MGRVTYRIRKSFSAHPVGKAWWGFVLDPIPCQTCEGAKRLPAGGYCPVCEGEGKVWPKVNPPGWPRDVAPTWVDAPWNKCKYGWQMWENTSEGSPVSPIFDTPEELARWLTDSGASASGPMGLDYDGWLRAVRGSGVLGMISDSAGVRPLVDDGGSP